MSEKLEKLVKIILPDLLNYLEMVEIIERRLKGKALYFQKNKDENDSLTNKDIAKYKKI